MRQKGRKKMIRNETDRKKDRKKERQKERTKEKEERKKKKDEEDYKLSRKTEVDQCSIETLPGAN